MVPTSAFGDNPFAVLTLIVAPAVLTNATSVLTLNTSNRFARVVDRSRVIMEELDRLEETTDLYNLRVRQLERLQLRGALLIQALTAFHMAIGAFAAAALISLLGATLAAPIHAMVSYIAAAVALTAGSAAVGGLVFGCTLVVRETRLAVLNLTEEAELAQSRYRSVSKDPGGQTEEQPKRA